MDMTAVFLRYWILINNYAQKEKTSNNILSPLIQLNYLENKCKWKLKIIINLIFNPFFNGLKR